MDVLAWLFPSMAAGVLISASFLPRGLGFFELATERFGSGLVGIWTAESALGLAVFLGPCLAAGAGFSHLAQLARGTSGGVARATAINFLGGAVGAPITGLFLLPTLGYKWSFLAIAFGYLMLIPHARTWSTAISLILTAVVCLLPEDLGLIRIPPGSQLVAAKTGSLATVTVLSDAEAQRSLRVNNRFQMGGTAASVAQRRQAHLPLLLHSNAQSALFLGSGTGITLGAATTYAGLRIDAVELLPEIVGMMDQFASVNRSPQRNPSVRVHAADARSFLRRSHDRYDVVIADLFHPAQDGSGALYTREHFQSIRDRLNPGGLFCQWLPLHQLDTAAWQTIAATFQSVFANTELWLLHFNIDIPVVGLVGRIEAGAKSEWTIVEARMKQADPGELRSAGIANPIQALGCLVVGADGLRALVDDSPLNLDSFPRVSFLAARTLAFRHSKQQSAALSLLDRVAALSPPSSRGGESASLSPEVIAFAKARDAYLRGMALESDADLSGAIERYFEAVKASLHFTPAYARLVGVIRVMAPADATRARSLYERLLKDRPDQPLGLQLLGPLFEGQAPREP
ncbi:MAG: fused MFS/spermidine synthase [Verrucomicrobia bacterium]|nr:fused MFS/spermidine synthase [Verrucomicrobiota bacterium]